MKVAQLISELSKWPGDRTIVANDTDHGFNWEPIIEELELPNDPNREKVLVIW